jgi:hypothetical protein
MMVISSSRETYAAPADERSLEEGTHERIARRVRWGAAVKPSAELERWARLSRARAAERRMPTHARSRRSTARRTRRSRRCCAGIDRRVPTRARRV